MGFSGSLPEEDESAGDSSGSRACRCGQNPAVFGLGCVVALGLLVRLGCIPVCGLRGLVRLRGFVRLRGLGRLGIARRGHGGLLWR